MPPGGFASRTFYALSNAQFRLLWLGTLFSFLGMQMQVLARGYLAYDLTGKNSALGGVMIAFGVPQLLLSLVGGVVADRFPKRTVLWVFQFIIAANSAWLAVMIMAGSVEYWMLIVAGVVQGAAFSFVGPARQAFIGDLVGRESIANAVVLQQLSMNSTRVIGPSIAGAMIGIAVIGVGGVYLMTTLGFAIAMISMIPLPKGTPRATARDRSPFGDLKDGVAYAFRCKQITALLMASFLVVMIGFPYQSFLPSLVSAEYGRGAGALGAMSSVGAVGAVLATIMVAALASSRRVWAIQPLAGAGFGLGLMALGLSPRLLAGLLVMFFVGAAGSAFQSLNNSLTMSLTEENYHGRVQSLSMMSWSFFGLASLPLGFIADAIGLRETFVIMGGLCVLSIGVVELIGRARNVSEDRATGITRAREPGPPVPTGGR